MSVSMFRHRAPSCQPQALQPWQTAQAASDSSWLLPARKKHDHSTSCYNCTSGDSPHVPCNDERDSTYTVHDKYLPRISSSISSGLPPENATKAALSLCSLSVSPIRLSSSSKWCWSREQISEQRQDAFQCPLKILKQDLMPRELRAAHAIAQRG